MAELVLSIKYSKNTGLVYNATELKNIYFTGIDFTDQFGNPIPEETINFYIEAAQREIENYLSLKFTIQAIKESRDYHNNDYRKFGYIPTTYPAIKAYAVKGFINTTLQINYPESQISTKRSSDQDLYWRSINLVPINGPSTTLSSTAVFIGVTPYMGFLGNSSIPNYWEIFYKTGFCKVPADILNVIGKKASISLFANIQDIVLGVGIASKSISADGIAQSIGTTSSAMYGLFSARINQYEKEMDITLPRLRSRYVGIQMGVL